MRMLRLQHPLFLRSDVTLFTTPLYIPPWVKQKNKRPPRLTTAGVIVYNMTVTDGRGYPCRIFCVFRRTERLDNVSIVVFSFVVLSGNELYVVGIDYRLLEFGSEIRVDGMHDVAVSAVGILS